MALMLSLRQLQFGIPSVDENQIDEIINDPLKIIDNTLMASDKSKGQFYVFPELLANSDFAKTKVAVKLSDLNIKSSVSVNDAISTLDKGLWESFWQVYNLIQQVTSKVE
jgi:hypothetical protein